MRRCASPLTPTRMTERAGEHSPAKQRIYRLFSITTSGLDRKFGLRNSGSLEFKQRKTTSPEVSDASILWTNTSCWRRAQKAPASLSAMVRAAEPPPRTGAAFADIWYVSGPIETTSCVIAQADSASAPKKAMYLMPSATLQSASHSLLR